MFQRRFRRISSLLMALLLCLSATVPALAEGGCAHADAYKIQGDVVDYVPDATSPVQHKVITVTYEYTYCPTCGEKFSGKPLDDTTQISYEDHNFVDGVCKLCKYDSRFADGCTGDHITSCLDNTVCLVSGQTIPAGESYVFHHGTTLDDTFETSINKNAYAHWMECSVCGRTYDDTAHSFVNGVCTGCGLAAFADGCQGYHRALCANPTVCAVSGETIPKGEDASIRHSTSLDSAESLSSRLQSNAMKHYTVVTCSLCNEETIQGESTHDVFCNNHTCADCGYVVSDDYVYLRHAGSIWQFDEYSHWWHCVYCNDDEEKIVHADNDGDGRCDSCCEEFDTTGCLHVISCGNNVCQKCGETVSPDAANVEIQHHYDGSSDMVSFGNSYHGYTCDGCGKPMAQWFHSETYGDLIYTVSHIDADGHGFRCFCGEYCYEPHTMVNGACYYCGYTGEARHYLDRMEGDVSHDETNHWRVCTYCNEQVSEPHSFINGACNVCGQACPHGTYTYSDTTQWQHLKVCAVCSNGEWENHVYENGICKYCNYDNRFADGCADKHIVSCSNIGVCLISGQIVPDDEPYDFHHGANIDDTYDSRIDWNAFNHWMICSNCGNMYDEAAHSFVNGVCTGCGLASFADGCEGYHQALCTNSTVCAVSGRIIPSGEDVITRHSASLDGPDCSETTLLGTYEKHFTIFSCPLCNEETVQGWAFHNASCTDLTCVDCGYVVSADYAYLNHSGFVHGTDEYRHWMYCIGCGQADDKFVHTDDDGDGYCDSCNTAFDNSTCLHVIHCGDNVCKKCGATVSPDAANVESQHHNSNISTMVPIENDYHGYRCEGCGKIMHKFFHTASSNIVYHTDDKGHAYLCLCGEHRFEPHTMIGGVCHECGYSGEAKHNLDRMEGDLSYDGTNHWRTCAYCNEQVREPHSYSNGVCTVCRYSCTHENCTYDESDSWSHLSVCSDCGKRTWEDHTYDNGVCTLCGFDNHLADGCVGEHIVSCADETICLTSGQKIGEDDWRYSVHHGSTTDSEFASSNDRDEYEHWTICSVCGNVAEYDEHQYEDGVCKECGLAACTDGCDGYHVALCENPGVCAVSNQAIPSGDYVHIHHGASLDEDADWEFSRYLGTYEKHYRIFVCPLCGTDDVWEWDFHQVTCTNPTCSECGYTVSEDYEYIQHADSDYIHNSTRHWKICPDCGAEHDDGFHRDYNDDGKCDNCDANTSSDACQHVVYCDDNVCDNCGETVSPDDKTVEVRHYYDFETSKVVPFENGYHGYVCDRCGAVTEKWFHGDSYDYRGDVISHIDANGHGYHCECGIFWYEPHVMIDGQCFECEYNGEAKHILKNMEGDWGADESGHWRTCVYCDEKVSKAHTFADDKCVVCGYVKGSVTPTPIPTATPTPVPTATPTAEPTAVPTVEPTAVPTAVPTAEPTAVPTAVPTAEPTAVPTAVPTAEPTAVPTAVPTAEPTAEPTAKPTAKPTSAPVVTPTPVPMPTVEPLDPVIDYEDVEETEAVHGVVATEPQRIATTLVTAIEQIELENVGKETSIEIRNVEKVITETEKVVFDTLPAKEQVLVLLSSIGYETEVASALSSMDMTLSEDAVALTTSIQERLANASEEEKAAFEQMLTDSFPVETITIDGVEYEYFVIELVVDIDGDVHVERYGFRFDENGEWIFSKLSIGTIVE